MSSQVQHDVLRGVAAASAALEASLHTLHREVDAAEINVLTGSPRARVQWASLAQLAAQVGVEASRRDEAVKMATLVGASEGDIEWAMRAPKLAGAEVQGG